MCFARRSGVQQRWNGGFPFLTARGQGTLGSMRTILSSLRFAPLAAAALAGSLAVLAPNDASALQAFGSDCNFGIKDIYNPGDAVCVTGEMDVVPPGKICPEGYVIITPANNDN